MTKKIVKGTETLQGNALAGSNLLKAMSELPEEWIENCYEARLASAPEEGNGKDTKTAYFGKFGKNTVKWVVAATVAILLCGGVCVTKWGWNQVQASKKNEFLAYTETLGIYEPGEYPFNTGKGRNVKGEETNDVYFYLLAKAERITAEELTGKIHEVKEFLTERLAEEDYSNRADYPTWSKPFKTVTEAKEYIGYAGLKETKTLGSLEWVNVHVTGDRKGNLAEVVLSAAYKDGDIQMVESAEVFTEESFSAIHNVRVDMTDVYGWGVSFRKEEYTNANGKTAVIVYEERENEKKENRALHGVITDEAVCYELILLYYPQDFERAKELMMQWCEQF